MNWTLNNLDLIGTLTLNHIRLALIPIVASFALSIPLGWLANRNRTLRALVITGGSLLYTIPSLPLFVILPLIIATRVLDETNLIVALTIYGVAIMTRSAADALASVDPITLDASTAIGFSPAGRFIKVELPLAGPVLLAGIRIVAVSTIALVSVGVIIGSANLGYLFQNGKQRGILEEVVVGILMSLLLALIMDLILVGIGKLLMPWNRELGSSGRMLPWRRRASLEAATSSDVATSSAGATSGDVATSRAGATSSDGATSRDGATSSDVATSGDGATSSGVTTSGDGATSSGVTTSSGPGR